MDFITDSTFLFMVIVNVLQTVMLCSTFYVVFHLQDKKKIKTLMVYVTVLNLEYVGVLTLFCFIKGFYPYEQLITAILTNVFLLVYLGITRSKIGERREVNVMKKVLYAMWLVGNTVCLLIFLNSM
ncbi:hypothetical protein [Bacillus toyonensis]|uniref:hypothetical protein n=1 Tax=Bacillus toyonensis TaxID=155322 RepID=UPI000BF33755|nr:hypothetical protein [Bacillus toyonensis]PGF05176.1 hypothetical protein COM61_01775 [Bacillus toyonensis]